MYDLLVDDAGEQLLRAQEIAGMDDAGAPRRVKVACSFQYPVSSASGVPSANPVSPLVPVVLARSFVIDGSQPDQLSAFSGAFAQAAAGWAAANEVTLGPTAQQGAQFVFDITLYAQISGLNTPVLRLRNLQLKLTDIAVQQSALTSDRTPGPDDRRGQPTQEQENRNNPQSPKDRENTPMETQEFELLGRLDVTGAAWNGQPMVLLVNQSASMPQTPNGTMVFAATNQATQNNEGTLILTSGGTLDSLTVPALANAPTVRMNNFRANNLNVTNTSANNATPILVQAVGPGIPGITPLPLGIGTPIQLAFGQSAQGNTNPQFMQLVIQSNAPTLGVVSVIGGPQDASGNNGMVIAVNAASNTGPGTGMAPPMGYYATTTGNTYTYSFNYTGASIFVSNLSPSTAQALSILLRAL
jgi:hypothetical protein